MRWNTKCICFTKLAETSWSKKNLKRCVPKRSSKDGWRAKDIPKRVAFRHFCHPVLRYGTQIRRLPRVTRLNETFKSSMSECRNVLVNALVKVTGTVRRSDLITSAKSFTSWVFAIPKFITAWSTFERWWNPSIHMQFYAYVKEPWRATMCIPKLEPFLILLVCTQSVIFYCFSNRSM